MQRWMDAFGEEKTGLQIAPLIDVVFLLLIYFMVASSLKKQEADLGFTLPGTVVQSETVAMPDEQIIDIAADGTVVLNESVYGSGGTGELEGLGATLARYRLASDTAGLKALITIQAADETLHQRVIDVMNVCKAAGITHVSFGL